MTEMRFYHLENTSLERALPQLLSAALSKGHRIVVKTPSEKDSERLNDILWSFKEDSFLPHGSAKDGHAKDQPIWITHENDNANTADVLVLTGGQDFDGKEDFALCCDMFEGNDAEHLQQARTRWKALKDQEHFKLSYFQQNENGKWEKKA